MINLPTYTDLEKTSFGPIRDIETIEVTTNNNLNPPGGELVVGDRKTFEVFELRKNGSTVDSSNYSFSRPDTITLDSNSSDGDVYEIDRLIYLERSQGEHYIDRAEDEINSELKNQYSVPFSDSDTPDRITFLTEKLARVFIIEALASMDDYQASDSQMDMVSRWRNEVYSTLSDLRNGLQELEGADATNEASVAAGLPRLDDSYDDTVVT